jgi:penicillin amidase
MLKWTRRIALLLAGVLLLAALAIWLLLRGSLPALEGEATLQGLGADATIQRDANGVVTIDAASEADALRALGFVHAQERYFEMDLLRRTAAGELSALFGPIAVDTDKLHRVHRMRHRVQRDMPLIAGGKQPQLQAYVDGVNAGLGALRVRPWPYLLLRQTPAPWTAEDTPLAGYAMYFDLQDGRNARELALWRMRPHPPSALYALLTRDGTRWDAPLVGEARGDAALPDAAAVDLRRLPAPTAPAPGQAATKGTPGSNNFAVSGALTADGRAIVADDMHLGLRAPNIWFRARLRYPDSTAPGGKVDVQGFTLPGLPAVIVGSNGHVAWGFTNSYGDYLDWKQERICASESAKEKSCARVQRVRERIAVAGADAVDFDVDATAWGPVLHREADGSALSLRWTAHLPGSIDLGIMRFATASGLDDALAIAQRAAVPTQNLVIADARGNVAWRLLGPLAMRAEGCGDGFASSGSNPSELENSTSSLRTRTSAQRAKRPQAGPGGTSAASKPVDVVPAKEIESGLPQTRAETPGNAGRARNVRETASMGLRVRGDDGAFVGPRIRTSVAAACTPWPIATNASPTLRSPQTDRIWTANNRTLDGAALRRVGDGGYAFGARAHQIREGLRVRDTFTERDLLALQLDDRAVLLTPWWNFLREQAARTRTPAMTALSDASARWEGRASTDSVSYRLVRAWRLAVHARIADGLTAPAQAALGKDFVMPDLPQLEGVVWPVVTQRPAHLLSRRYATWDALFEDAAKQVRDDLSKQGPLHERTWGERNTAAICNPLAGAIPLLGKRLLCMPPDPLPGDGSMPRVQGPAFGASQRMVVSPGRERDGIIHMPGGQSGHFLSPYWGAGHDDWVQGRPSPFLPGAPDRTLTLRPAR